MIFYLNIPSEREKFQKLSEKFLENNFNVELKKVHKKRSIRQNSFLHVLISLFGIEHGYSIEESKTVLKRSCPFMRYEKKGQWFLKKTRDMTTIEISDFIDWIYTYSAKNGLVLPTLEDYKSNQSLYDSIIESNKEFS